jgi:ubiquinone/menaquinone biosynthesis C-methylase UbiE
MTDTERFDQAASTWDLEERRVALAAAVTTAITARLNLSKEQSVLDFGCGTGLVTLALAPLVGTVTGADTSLNMLKILKEKAEALRIPLRLLPLGPGGLGGPYDLIVSSMTLHHVEDAQDLFHQFSRHLHPGGQIALADLDTEDGLFHGDMAGVHHRGFSREVIQAWLAAAGFQEILLQTATLTHKDGREYSVFLATARKS